MFRSESRAKSLSTKGATGGVRGCKPEVRDSSQSAASNAGTSDLLFLEGALRGGVVQRGGGPGLDAWGRAWAGEGGSSNRSEEQSGEERPLSPFELDWVGCIWSDGEAGEEVDRVVMDDWSSEVMILPEKTSVTGNNSKIPGM